VSHKDKLDETKTFFNVDINTSSLRVGENTNLTIFPKDEYGNSINATNLNLEYFRV
jgi:hypothetical protein